MTAPSSTPLPPTSSRSSASDGMRGDLVRAALKVLGERGAAGLTVRNITQEAGCSTTGVYTYFGGKSGLVDAIVIDGFESFDEAVDAGLQAGDMMAAGRAYRAWALAHRTQYMVMFGGSIPDHELSDTARGRALESFTRLAEGVARSNPAADFAERAYHLFATVHGYVMLEMAGMASATEEESTVLYERALAQLG